MNELSPLDARGLQPLGQDLAFEEEHLEILRGGTGSKRRMIRALDANSFELFSFERSINPRGGYSRKDEAYSAKNGRNRMKIFQDTNSNGRVSSKEIIFHGKSRELYDSDELIKFRGSARLKKTMHQCTWLSMKFPDEQIMCTREYIPTIYELTLTANSGDIYKFDGTGAFEDPIVS